VLTTFVATARRCPVCSGMHHTLVPARQVFQGPFGDSGVPDASAAMGVTCEPELWIVCWVGAGGSALVKSSTGTWRQAVGNVVVTHDLR
jgi:hypothetical protein